MIEFGQDWKKISEQMGMKQSKEALIEFLRIKTPELYSSNKYLEVHAERIAKENDIKIAKKQFSHVDQYFLQCQMLQKFSQEPSVWLKPKKREHKLNQKLAFQILIADYQTMQEEFKHLVETDNSQAKMMNDYRNLQSQLFSERVSMQMAGRTKFWF